MTYGVAPPGFRLPAATRLGAVWLEVSDLERSLHYYQSILGLAVIERGVTGASLAAQGEDRALLHLHTGPGVRATPRGSRLGLYHFALLVPDRASLGRFVTHLGESGVPVATADHAVSEAVYLWDPDNLGIEVYADRPRSAWRLAGTELFMTTERLDVRALAAAAGERRWTGMPAGTVLGHMHLHVGDLADGEAFYHRGLGLDKTVWSYPGALFLSAGGYHHHLGTNTWAAGASPAREHEARLLEWEVRLPSAQDVEAAVRSLEDQGYSVTREDYGVVAADPWGTKIRLKT